MRHHAATALVAILGATTLTWLGGGLDASRREEPDVTGAATEDAGTTAAHVPGLAGTRTAPAPAAAPSVEDVNARVATLADRLAAGGGEAGPRLAADLAEASAVVASELSEENRERLWSLFAGAEDPRTRDYLARAIARAGRHAETARRLVPMLRKRCRDEIAFAAVCEALAGSGGPEQIPVLVVWLDPDSRENLRAAAGALARIGGAASEEALRELVRGDLDPASRRAAEGAWRHVDDASAYARVAASLGTASRAEAGSLLRILRLRPDPEHAPEVAAFLRGERDEASTFEAVQTLAAFGDPFSVERVLMTMDAGGPAGRLAALALRRIEGAAALERAAEHWDRLGSEGKQSLLQAALAAKDAPARVLEAARSVAADAEAPSALRALAAAVVGRPGNDAAVESLGALLAEEDAEDEVRDAALHALRRIGTPAAATAALEGLGRGPRGSGEGLRDWFEGVRGDGTKGG